MVAVSTVVFDGLRLGRSAGILADLGVAEVELAYIEGYTPFDEGIFAERTGREASRLFADHGVTVRAVSAHTDLGRPDSVDRLLRRLDFASGAGADTLVSNATTIHGGAEFMRNLASALPRFEDAGVVLAIENPGHGSDALLPDGKAGARIAAEWDSPWLRLNYDVCNAYTYARGQIDLARDLDAALPFARQVHLKDVAETGSDWEFCPIGKGVVGYGQRISLSGLGETRLSLEHPIALWRPGRANPLRRSEAAAEGQMRAILAASLHALQDLRLS